MAGAGWRDFVVGEVVTEPYIQTYLMDQAVMVFASAAARTSAVSSPSEGMVSYLSDTNLLYFYDGAAWTQIPATVNVRKNSAGTVYTQPRVNLIEGTGINLTVADDGSEIDVTIAATGTNPVTSVVKSADESVTSSTTLQDDDVLLTALAANKDYSFECWLLYTCAAAGDLKIAFTTPAGSTVQWSAQWLDGANPAAAAPVQSSGTAKAITSTNTNGWVRVSGSVLNAGTAGNLTLQWAQNTSDATATVVKAGSYLKTTQES